MKIFLTSLSLEISSYNIELKFIGALFESGDRIHDVDDTRTVDTEVPPCNDRKVVTKLISYNDGIASFT